MNYQLLFPINLAKDRKQMLSRAVRQTKHLGLLEPLGSLRVRVTTVAIRFETNQQARSFFRTVVRNINEQKPEEGPSDSKIVATPKIEPPSETVFVDAEETFKDAKDEVEVPLLLRLWREYFVRYAIIAVAGLTFLWILYDVTDWFSSMYSFLI